MMKKILIASVVAVATLASCGNGTSVPAPKNGVDSVSVALGSAMGSQFKTMQLESDEYDIDLVVSAMRAAAAGEEVMTMEQINEVLGNYFQVVKPARTLKASEEFLTKAEKDGGVKTESGLVYKMIEAGDAALMPVEGDTVKVHYTGMTPSGDVFDSSVERGEAVEFPLKRGSLITGWVEGMQFVGKGGKIELYIPSSLAYGAQGRGSAVAPNQALKFEIELIDVKKFKKTEE